MAALEENNIQINVSGGAEEKKEALYVKWAKQVFCSIASAKWVSILKVYIVMLFFLATGLMAMFVYTAIKDKEFVKMTAERIAQGQKAENLRDFVVTPKIQRELSTLVYTMGADRAFLFEFHNGKSNGSGLPFRYIDMTYEEVNEERKVDKIAMQCQNIPLTLYRFPNYLQQKKFVMGTVDEIEAIDAEYAKHVREFGGKYLALIYINSGGVPLGFLGLEYANTENIPTEADIIKKMQEYDKVLTQLLDLQVQMDRLTQHKTK